MALLLIADEGRFGVSILGREEVDAKETLFHSPFYFSIYFADVESGGITTMCSDDVGTGCMRRYPSD